MTSSVLKGAVLGGIVVFAWYAVSWMYLPWHEKSLHSFSQEALVEQALIATAPQDGLYVLPNPHAFPKDSEQYRAAKEKMQTTGPFAFVVFNRQGAGPMLPCMLRGLLLQMAGAGLLTLLVLQTAPSFGRRLFFIFTFALAAGVICFLPDLNWWKFPADYVLYDFADLLIGWSLAGLVIAQLGLKSAKRGR